MLHALLRAGLVLDEETPKAKAARRQEADRRNQQEAIERLLELGENTRSQSRVQKAEVKSAPGFGGWSASEERSRFLVEEPTGSEEERIVRHRGQMIWLHKTAPVLVIEGREGLRPEDYAAGRRR